MRPEWTGKIVGEMHVHEISAEALAKELGWHPKYLSVVLNGKRTPADAEQKCEVALKNLMDGGCIGKQLY